MSNLSIVSSGPESLGADGQPTSNPRQFGQRPQPAPETEIATLYDPEQRLIIEEDGDTGALVYTVVDRASGQVVAKASREDVARMRARSDYSAGSLIKAKA